MTTSDLEPFDLHRRRFFQSRVARRELYVIVYAIRCPESTEVIFDNYWPIFVQVDSSGNPHLLHVPAELERRKTVPYGRAIDGRPIFIRWRHSADLGFARRRVMIAVSTASMLSAVLRAAPFHM